MPTIINGTTGIDKVQDGSITSSDLASGAALANIGANGITAGYLDTQSQYTGFKNRIINGAMMIDQRNAGASVTPNNSYSLDRWYSTNTQTSKFTIQQNAGSVTPPVGFTNYLGVTSSSAYSVTSSDTFLVLQPIEGFNTADLGFGTSNAKTVTLSFQVYSSLTGTFGGALANSAGNRSYPFSYTVSSANTWTSVSVTIPGDTSGTWVGATNGIGVIVRFGLGSGSTYSGTAGAWASSNIVQPTGTVSVVGTNGATFYITGVQLEKGSTATSFDYRPYGTELALCQRYASSTFPIGTAWVQNAGLTGAILQQDSGSSGYGSQIAWRFPVTMRATPTVVTYNPQAANSNVRNVAATSDCTTVSASVPNSMNGANIVGVPASPAAGATLSVHFSASAEL